MREENSLAFKFVYYYNFVAACKASPPLWANASTTFDENAEYSHTGVSTVLVDCDSQYEWAFGQSSQEVTCLQTGWDLTTLQPCYRGESFRRLRLSTKKIGDAEAKRSQIFKEFIFVKSNMVSVTL